MPEGRISLLQKFALIFLGFFFAFLLIEAGLRVGSDFYLFKQRRNNVQALKSPNAYRILCLGESTTAQGSDQSYPRQLERFLNHPHSDVQFSIINKGRPAVFSKEIMSNLKEYLDAYKPDMVVSMMGINDTLYSQEEESSLDFLHLRTIKLFEVLKTDFEVKWMRWQAQMLDKTDTRLDVTFMGKKTKKVRIALSNIFARKGASARSLEKYQEAEQYLIKATRIAPENINPYMELVILYEKQLRSDLVLKTYQVAVEHNPEMSWAYAGMANFYLTHGNKEKAREYGELAQKFELKDINPLTQKNHRTLYQTLKERGIQYVCVQYPFRNIEVFKQIFDKDADILFVENRTNFDRAVNTRGYYTYFIDSFAGDFGHFTKKGSQLLAENIGRTILDYLKL